MSLFGGIWKAIFGVSSWSHPDDVRVSPSSYREQVRGAFWHAVARLEAIGIKARRHDIARVDVRPGTVKRPAGWALPCAASSTGYAGGWRESKRLVVVCDPNTGAASSAVLAHEWAHALTDMNGGPYEMEAQHEVMRRAGLM